MSGPHLDPTDAQAVRLFGSGHSGPVLMLNLLRFRETADYGAFPEIAPAEAISGRAAYQRYIDHTLPFLTATGGGIDLLADGGGWFVGPEDEQWDLAMLVRQDSLEAFLAFASNAAYLAGIGHRTAAVVDSRILPLRARGGSTIV